MYSCAVDAACNIDTFISIIHHKFWKRSFAGVKNTELYRRRVSGVWKGEYSRRRKGFHNVLCIGIFGTLDRKTNGIFIKYSIHTKFQFKSPNFILIISVSCFKISIKNEKWVQGLLNNQLLKILIRKLHVHS